MLLTFFEALRFGGASSLPDYPVVAEEAKTDVEIAIRNISYGVFISCHPTIDVMNAL
jgi:hypothetical protein